MRQRSCEDAPTLKPNAERISGWLCAAGWGISVLLLVTGPSLAQVSRFVKAKNFKFPEYYESLRTGQIQTNRLKALLIGAQGQYLSNDLFLLNQMQLDYYEMNGRTSLVARAPECLFDAESRVAFSTGRLEIVGLGGGLVVHGQAGFEVRMTNSTMSLSNRVRTVIRQDVIQASRK
jgi:hypothetical protein